MGTVLASAANERYGFHLLNMIGSVERNSDRFERIVVYDLGLTDAQRTLAHALRRVEVKTVLPFCPHWSKCFSWKPWIWTHLDAEQLLWLDAGVTVLRPLDEMLAAIGRDGHFLVGQMHLLGEIVPSDYYDLYGLPRKLADREYAAAGIIGFRRDGEFFNRVVRATYDDVLLGRNLGFSATEVDHLNWGMTELAEPIVRDCLHFRHDQTLLNIHLALELPDAHLHDVHKYGGSLSPHDHPQQLIWNHRRGADFRYVSRASYRAPYGLLARRTQLSLRYGGWKMRNRRFFQPSAYWRKALGAFARPS